MIPLEIEERKDKYISSQCYFRDNNGFRIVFAGWIPLYRYGTEDQLTEKFVIGSLIKDGLAKQVEVAEAFGYGVSSVRHWQREYELYGIEGLVRKKRESPLLKMGGPMDVAVRKLFKQGVNNCEIGRRLGVNEKTIRQTLKRLGLKRVSPKKKDLFELELKNSVKSIESFEDGTKLDTDVDIEKDNDGKKVESNEEAEEASTSNIKNEDNNKSEVETENKVEVKSLDTDATKRVVDRMMARQGLLKDAEPVFVAEKRIPCGGVLLAVPLIVGNEILGAFEKFYKGVFGNSFYGLRTIIMTLLIMALIRIKRPENLKDYEPEYLGRILGLDRIPEVKTLRCKLGKIANEGKGTELMRELANKRLKDRDDLIGFLYVDGHVREYHGKGKLSKTHIPCRRLADKATTDTWVNDANGDPVFLITSEINAGLTKMLEPVLNEIEEIVGKGRKVTMAFDRGGWDLKLFARIIGRGYDILTYRKGKCEELPKEAFHEQITTVEGQEVNYRMHEMSIRIGKVKITCADGKEKDLWMRQVTRLKGEHQTQVLTTRQDLCGAEVLWRMFNRWRQENFFKYMKEEYAIDGLVDYNLESVSSDLDRPNPERSNIEKNLVKAKDKLRKLEAEYGSAAANNEESKELTMEDFKIANSEIEKALSIARECVLNLKAKRDELPKRVAANDLDRLNTERKLITDSVKITAYQIETELVRMVCDYYRDVNKDGHKLIVSAMKSPADIAVADGKLYVTLSAQSSLHRSSAIAGLCKLLNAKNSCFPGTNLRLHYSVTGTY